MNFQHLLFCTLYLVCFIFVDFLTAHSKPEDAERADYDLVRQFLRDEIAETTTVSSGPRVKNLITFLAMIESDFDKALKDSVQSLAGFLKSRQYKVFDQYMENVIKASNFDDVGSYGKFLDDAFESLSDPESEEAALEILRQENEDAESKSFSRVLTSTLIQLPEDILDKVKDVFKASKKQKSLALAGSTKIANPKLLAAQLAFDVLDSMYRWWNDKISGRRCAKNIIDSSVSTMGGASGAGMGIYLGFLCPGPFVPICASAGAYGGAYFGSKAAEKLIKNLTENIFNLPKSEAEEKAYRFFGLDKQASISEINDAYRRLAQYFHPDNRPSGDKDKFLEVNIQMQILRMSKGKKSFS